MMAIVNSETRFMLLDRQTGEGMPKQSQEEKDHRWQEVWRGEAEAGRQQGQAPEEQSSEDRSREPGREGATQAPEEDVT